MQKRLRKLRYWLGAWVLLLAITAPALAQQNNGSVCIIVYNDANRNVVRDAGEDVLLNVNVSLMVAPNIIVANYVTDSKEPFCFTNLPANKQYTLMVDSPSYEPTDPKPVVFSLSSGERKVREFGAVARQANKTASLDDTIFYIPLTTPVRIGLSMACALGSMTLLIGFGMLFYGLFLYPRRRKATAPPTTWEVQRAEEEAQ